MKHLPFAGALALLSLVLVSCDRPQLPDNTAADETRRQLEETQAAYAQQAADMQSRSEELQQQLADLQRSIQEKENAELQAKLEAIQRENEKLMADAEAARLKSEQLRDELANRPVITEPAPYVPPAPISGGQAWADPDADYSMFYEELNPHGQWLDVEGYGYAWRPNLASRSTWRPYMDGRWVWSDHGWAWDTPEPFGWATYHYGRWVRISRHGWVWVPGREWAPAWVSWRSGGDCVGWAPLPPSPRRGFTSISYDCDVSYGLSPSSYIFIESVNFGRSSYLNVSLSQGRVTSIFQQTVNVTNIIRINQQQTNFFVNRGGPDRNWLEQRIGGRIPVAPVRISRTLERPVSGRDRDFRDGVRPLIAAALPSGRGDRPTRPTRIAGKIARPDLVDAWTEVPTDRRKSLRDMIVRQAKDPKPPRPEVVSLPPKTPERDREPTPGPRPGERPGLETKPETRPVIPLPGGMPTPPDRITERERDRRPGEMRPEIAPNDANKAELSRREAELMKQREAAAQQAEAMKSREAAMAEQQELARKQAEANAMKEQLMEQQKRSEELRRQQVEGMKMREREAAADTAKKMEMDRLQRDEAMKAREAAMAEQQELARKQAEANAMKGQLMEQQKHSEELRRQHVEGMKMREVQAAQQAEMDRRQRDIEATRAREAAMAQQQEMARKQAEAEAMQRRQREVQQQQEMANRQREALIEKAREAAARQQEEMANRQREAMRQQQESAQKPQEQRPPEPRSRPPEEAGPDRRRER